MKRAMVWLFLPLLLMAAPDASQAQEIATDEAFCPHQRMWVGRPADIAAIETVPVPQLFRTDFETSDPCGGRIVPGYLIQWHLRFGSQRSTSAALAYLESGYMSRSSSPANHARNIERAWQSASADIRRAGAMSDHRAQWQFAQQSRSIRRLSILLQERDRFRFLSAHFLSAAEEFGSLELLDKAELYLRPLLESDAFLAPLQAQLPVNIRSEFQLESETSDDMALRAAVLRAELSGAPEAVTRAREMLHARHRPLFEELAAAAYSGGADFCDIGVGVTRREELNAECERSLDVRDRVGSYWRAAALLNLMEGDFDGYQDSVQVATDLFERERASDIEDRCCGTTSGDTLLRLRLARARAVRSLMEAPAEANERHDLQQTWRETLRQLRNEECNSPPFAAPTRFRRIAEAWLDLWQRRDMLSEDGLPYTDADFSRYAAYLHHVLSGLDRIVAGAP